MIANFSAWNCFFSYQVPLTNAFGNVGTWTWGISAKNMEFYEWLVSKQGDATNLQDQGTLGTPQNEDRTETDPTRPGPTRKHKAIAYI